MKPITTTCPNDVATAVSSRYKWYLVAILWWISFFNYADRQALSAVSKLLESPTVMGLSKIELGALGSAFAWTYGLCSPLAGHVVDRVRRKTAILSGLHVWSLICMATALCATAPLRGFWPLFVFRAAEGLGETFYYPASTSMLSAYHGKATRSRALGFHQTSVYVGTIGGGFFAAFIGERYGWWSSFVVFGSAGLLLGLVVSRWVIEPVVNADDLEAQKAGEPVAATRRVPMREFLQRVGSSPPILFLMAAFLCANYVAMVLLFWITNFVATDFGFSLALAGLTATVFPQVASMVGAPVGGWLADLLRKRTRAGRMLVQALGVLGAAPAVVLCGQTNRVPLLIVALLAWGFFKGLYDANIFASVFDVIRPEARGTAAGFMNMVGWLGGGATAPVVIGYLAEHYGFGLAISSAALVYVAAAVFLGAAGLAVARQDPCPSGAQ
ncbi:MAG TPA: MFS transporter [Gemmataceae bacterium]|nr:MFS transporter [Gemmataceae bacterium]